MVVLPYPSYFVTFSPTHSPFLLLYTPPPPPACHSITCHHPHLPLVTARRRDYLQVGGSACYTTPSSPVSGDAATVTLPVYPCLFPATDISHCSSHTREVLERSVPSCAHFCKPPAPRKESREGTTPAPPATILTCALTPPLFLYCTHAGCLLIPNLPYGPYIPVPPRAPIYLDDCSPTHTDPHPNPAPFTVVVVPKHVPWDHVFTHSSIPAYLDILYLPPRCLPFHLQLLLHYIFYFPL